MNLNRRKFLLVASGSLASVTLPASPHSNLARPFDPQYGSGDLPLISPAFHVQNSLRTIPELSHEVWQLTIHGPNEPQIITWSTLQFFPQIETMLTIECIGNPTGGEMIGNALWRGVRLRDLISTDLPFLNFKAADGYQTSLPREIALQPSTLLAYAMNGQPLAPEHGYPLRLIVGGVYGFKMPKWITEIEPSHEPVNGFWESLGWSASGELQTHAAFTHPPHRTQIQGQIRLQGYAFGKNPITRVEISVDGGEWIPTTLIPSDSPYAWTRWFLDWSPEQSGVYQLAVRASDSEGFTQMNFPNPLKKTVQYSGNTLIHSIEVVSR